MAKILRKDLQQLVRIAVDAGWVIAVQANGHLEWTPPHGPSFQTASTPSDPRSLHNIKSKLRAAGLAVGHKGYTAPKARA